jgi:hypothetical protein
MLCGVLYLGYGLWVLLSPTTSLDYLGVDLTIVNAMSDLRGSHGGLNVAIGLFLLWAAGSRLVPLRPLAGVPDERRLFRRSRGGRAGDGMPTGIVPLVMLMEVVLFITAFVLARRATTTAAPRLSERAANLVQGRTAAGR